MNSQNEFFEQNKDKVEDTEENKLEYTPIFEAYMLILETVIEVELQKTFSHEDIKAFYQHFKENLGAYEEKNKDTVDTLYSFIDFDKFKQAILKYKSDVATASKVTTGSAETIGFRIDEATFNRLEQEVATDPKSGWKQGFHYPFKEGEGYSMTFWSKAIPELKGKNLNKAVMVIKDTDIEIY